jgi:hypothetical protein
MDLSFGGIISLVAKLPTFQQQTKKERPLIMSLRTFLLSPAKPAPPPPEPKWNRPEWWSQGEGVFQLAYARSLYQGEKVLKTELFPEILVRFIQEHPKLEIVTITPVWYSGHSYPYYVVLTRPKPAMQPYTMG